MDESSPSRRGFLRTTATAALASGAVANAAQPVHTGTDETLRVGLIGCGGRGQGAAIEALMADPQARLVAVGDAFEDRARKALSNLRSNGRISSQVDVPEDRIFSDFGNFKQVIDSGVDVVLLATPPHFRPEHLRYSVEAGKHTFVEKPVGVDVPGVLSVGESCKLAESKGLSIVSGLCWRYQFGIKEMMRRVLEEKVIGDILAVDSRYNSGTLWYRKPTDDWSRMEHQMRNWLYYTWLSGDHIMEQAIHSIDKAAWLMGDASPVRAMATGGRQQRTEAKFGNIYDHFSVFYEFESGQRVFLSCRQQAGTSTQVSDRVLATGGQAETADSPKIFPNGGKPWRYRGAKERMWLTEQKEFFKSIRAGTPINNGHYMCNSTLMALMGRLAAYTGQTLTWDQLLGSKERLGPTDYAWTDVPEPAVAMPGVTKFV